MRCFLNVLNLSLTDQLVMHRHSNLFISNDGAVLMPFSGLKKISLVACFVLL